MTFIRFYGRRKNKPLRPSREILMDSLLPKLLLPKEGVYDFSKMFPNKKEIWLEVGFGGGEHFAALCRSYPDIGFIGAEPFINGVASLLAHLNGSHEAPGTYTDLAPEYVPNMRIYPDDIRQVFPLFPKESLSRIFVLYPDPWPKARHAGRRFMNVENLKTLAALLKKGGQIDLATDMPFYMDFAVEQAELSGLFTLTGVQTTPPKDWITTRYEQKALAAGRTPLYTHFIKK